MTKRYAPTPGDDAEFDDMFEKTWEALEASGNPEGITREVARETLARRQSEFGGKTYAVADVEPVAEDENGTPVALADLTVPKPVGEPYWYEKAEDARLIEHYIMSRRELGTRFHGALLIVGESGYGKTMGVGQAVARINAKHGLQMRLLKMDCATITDPQKWFGRREIDKDGSVYHKSDFIRAVENGDGILLDEVTRIHPTIGNVVHSLLDGSQSLHLSDLNLTVAVHPNTWFIATANIGAQYGGTHRMDQALRGRFMWTIEREAPPQDEEIRILVSHTGIDPDAASVLVAVAQKTRSMYLTGDIRQGINTRTLRDAAWLVASGMSEREALSYTALPLFDGDANGSTAGEKSDRMQVKAIIDGKGR